MRKAVKWLKKKEREKRKHQNQITFIFIAQHELLFESKSEKYLSNLSTRDTHMW